MQYKLQNSPFGGLASVIKKIEDDGTIRFVPNDPANTDWQEYQAWLAADPENNVPEPADEE